MNNLLLLLFCFLLGVALRRTGQLPDNAASSLNGFVVNISLPALILLQLRELDIDRALLMPVLMAWLVFGLACVFFGVTGQPTMCWASNQKERTASGMAKSALRTLHLP